MGRIIHSLKPLIRFSSQQYTLRSFHESVHLCNNAIQRKYFNGKRSHRLPLQNMWAKETFLDFLRSHNLGNHASVIDSGIKKAIIGWEQAVLRVVSICQVGIISFSFNLWKSTLFDKTFL